MAGNTFAFLLSDSLRGLVRQIAEFFESRNVRSYAVGGFVRDGMLCRPMSDLDVGIDADPVALSPDLAEGLGGSHFALDEERGVVRVMLPEAGVHLDLQRLRGSVEDDMFTRDFTIDAMAAELSQTGSGSIELIDPASGLGDLSSRTVRAVSEANLIDDPLRLLRGVRLASVLGFSIEPGTAEMIRRNAALSSTPAAERQSDELMLILKSGSAGVGLRLMDELGLLTFILPELDVTRGVDQPREHHWDVFNHSLQAVGAMDMLLAVEEPEDENQGWLWRELWSQLSWWPEARARVSGERAAVLKLACLLHDIGKPETKSFQDDGRMRFFGHADVGAAISRKLMRRLRFSAREVATVAAMVGAHMRPLQMAQQGAPTNRAIYRFFRDTGGAGADTLFLSLADHLAAVGPRVTREGWRRHVAIVSYILRKASEEHEVITPKRLIDGDELMAELDVPAGPELGRMLEKIREAQAAGEVRSREEALELARRHLEQTAASG